MPKSLWIPVAFVLLLAVAVAEAGDAAKVPAKPAPGQKAVAVPEKGEGQLSITINGQSIVLPAPDGKGVITLGEKGGAGVVFSTATLAGEPGRPWLGVMAVPPPEELRKKLNLPKDQGLMIAHVAPKSPAAKAGLKERDVLLKANQAPLGKLEDLMAAVAAAQGKELTLELNRDGKPLTLKAKPEPMAAGSATFHAMPGMPGMPGAPVGPHGMFSFSVSAPALPHDMTVTISRTGTKPAKITVQQGGKSWEAVEGDLKKLPDAARAYVERQLGGGSIVHHGAATRIGGPGGLNGGMMDGMMGRGYSGPGGPFGGYSGPAGPFGGGRLGGFSGGALFAGPGGIVIGEAQAAPGATITGPAKTAHSGNVSQQLEAISQQLKQIQQAVEQLKAERPKTPKGECPKGCTCPKCQKKGEKKK